VPSSPVIPYDDPTLLFTNAGMNQFKDVFTGKQKAAYKRATSSQKCIRAGGKHNDLDNVGFTARHHTFFEMLGNFSFGDYFKEDAIAFCWEWVTREIKLSPQNLYATVYEKDDEAFAFWEKIAPELKKNERIKRFGKKDNYWSMGDVGPCGPCSELHYDRGEKFGTGPNDVLNGETDRFVEIWNLVFMQFDQLPDGKLVDLPKPSVDTGAGLERLAAIVQNVDSNYQIDIFKNIIKGISEIAKSDYRKNPSSHHVIADHLRALTFAIADGAGISNEGQGYVLRRILRRAARHGRNLGVEEPFIYKLVQKLVDEMGNVYPEIGEKQKHIESVIKTEEEAFGRTLETGLEHIETIVKKLKETKTRVIPGEDVFRLYDTYGFPYDLTEIIAAEHGFTLDKDGFDKSMQKQQEQSKAAGGFVTRSDAISNLLEKEKINFEPTEFVRDSFSTAATLQYVNEVPDEKSEKKMALAIVDKTPMYVESGGQISDIGTISTDKAEIEVKSMQLHNNFYIHVGEIVEGKLADFSSAMGKKVTVAIDSERRWDIMRNHTATHLAHAALRKVLGTHVKQSGSYVGPDRLRFDFSHHRPMSPEQIEKVWMSRLTLCPLQKPKNQEPWLCLVKSMVTKFVLSQLMTTPKNFVEALTFRTSDKLARL
jgi:alanyl-tRNA synthetase